MHRLLIITGAVLSLSVAYYFIAPGDPPRSNDPWKACDRGDDQIAVDSPGRSWTARGIYWGCGGPMTIRAQDNVVIVKRDQEPTLGDEVLTGDWQMNLVRLEWKSEKHLQITLPINAVIYRQETGLHDIAVAVKFEPNNPKVREAFLREPKKFVREPDGGLRKLSPE